MEQELDSYAARMSSMLDSALDADGLRACCEALAAEGLQLQQASPMHVQGETDPIGWVVVASRAPEIED
jgi:hypothetical protein